MQPQLRANECSVQEFLRIKRASFQEFPERYHRMAQQLRLKQVDLERSIPTKILTSWQSSVMKVLEGSILCEKDGEYLRTLARIKSIIGALRPSLLNEEMIAKTNGSLASRFSSLMPDHGSFHDPIHYSNSGSVTGRLTVISGPNVLTMPSEYKKLLKSRFDGGRILQIDLIAAEPTVALNVMGRPPEKDPYVELSETVFRSLLDRDACKKVVLCSLYGQSRRKLSESMGADLNVNDTIEATKRHFDYDGLLAHIRENTDENLWMRNFFGRPVPLPDSSDSIALSYFLQSTAAEAAILAFGDLLERTRDHCIPLHIIHDAILLDCKEDYAKFLISKGTLRLKLNNWTLPAKVSLAS